MQRYDPFDKTYQALFNPWLTVATGSQAVIAMRLAQLPLLWLTQPAKADRESRRMVEEKLDAWQEWQRVAWQAPWHFWMDIISMPLGTPAEKAWIHALNRAGRRGALPYGKRVTANKRRLRK